MMILKCSGYEITHITYAFIKVVIEGICDVSNSIPALHGCRHLLIISNNTIRLCNFSDRHKYFKHNIECMFSDLFGYLGVQKV